jgi:hypothetical protein
MVYHAGRESMDRDGGDTADSGEITPRFHRDGR